MMAARYADSAASSFGGALAEVGPRGGLDAAGAATVIDGVEIVGQNLVLASTGSPV